MDASAFGSLLSLSEILDNIKRRSVHGLTRLDQQQIDDFQETVHFLLGFLESLSPGAWRQIEGFMRKIPQLVFVSKNTIDHHVVEQMRTIGRQAQEGGVVSSFREDLSCVVREMEMIKEEAVIFGGKLESSGCPDFDPPKLDPIPTLSRRYYHPIGFGERVKQLTEELSGNNGAKQLKVIPIVGMGGIGKTTLARCVYEDPFSVRRFDRRIWCTVSRNCDVRSILQEILGDKVTNEIWELGEKLHGMLYGRRYLVVLDDIWSPEAWEELRPHFQDGSNASRIIITTRDSSLVRCLCSSNSQKPLEMELLDKDQSWELLREKVFTSDDRHCPPHLEEIGKEISASCRGLPLSVVAVAGLLSKSNMALEYWEYVASNVSSLVSSANGGNCLDVLSFSYDNMPLHLKLCFLYLGFYKEDEIIEINGLMEMWTCAAVLKPLLGKTMEETGREYLKDLIARNLVMSEPLDYGSKVPTRCRIHDLMREVCLRETQNGKIISNPRSCFWYGGVCHTCFGINYVSNMNCHYRPTGLESNMSCGGSLLHQVHRLGIKSRRYPLRCKERKTLTTCSNHHLRPCSSNRNIHFHVIDADISIGASSRIAALKHCIPVHFFWNVVFLEGSLSDLTFSSSVIRGMPQLQWYRCYDADFSQWILLMSLEKLSVLKCNNLICTREMVQHIPNLKVLDISYNKKPEKQSFSCLQNIGYWHRLEKLSLQCVKLYGGSTETMMYPQSLKALKLTECNLFSGHTKVIGSLLNLKTLYLLNCVFGVRHEWNMGEVEFPELEYLEITEFYDAELHRWRAKASNLPCLETLVMKGLDGLEKIPLDVGNIATLARIRVFGCSDGVVESAKRILRNQRRSANDTLQLHITPRRIIPHQAVEDDDQNPYDVKHNEYEYEYDEDEYEEDEYEEQDQCDEVKDQADNEDRDSEEEERETWHKATAGEGPPQHKDVLKIEMITDLFHLGSYTTRFISDQM